MGKRCVTLAGVGLTQETQPTRIFNLIASIYLTIELLTSCPKIVFISSCKVVKITPANYSFFIREPTGQPLGLDVGIKYFYTDSNGETVDRPKLLPQSERQVAALL